MSYSPSAIRNASCRTLEYECTIGDNITNDNNNRAYAGNIYSLGTISANSYYKFLISLKNTQTYLNTKVNGFIEFEIMGDEIMTIKSSGVFTNPSLNPNFYIGIFHDKDNTEPTDFTNYKVIISGISGKIDFNVEYTFEPFNYFSSAVEVDDLKWAEGGVIEPKIKSIIIGENEEQEEVTVDSVKYEKCEYNKYIIVKPLELITAVSTNFEVQNLRTNTIDVEKLVLGNWSFTVKDNGNLLEIDELTPGV